MDEKKETCVTTSLLDNPTTPRAAGDVQAANNPSTPTDLRGRLTVKLALAVFACVIGSSFQFGYHTGVMNTPQQLFQEQFKYGFMSPDVVTNSTVEQYSDDQVLLLWSVTVSMFGAGGMVGGFTGSYFATKLGRKKMMMANNVLLVIACALMISTKFAGRLEFMIVGRIIHGINAGFSTVVAPLYLNEISPMNLRGGVGTTHQLAVTSGILISQALGLTQVLGNYNSYYLLFGIPLIGGACQLLILPFCPESPSWLYITRRSPDLSKKALSKLGGAFNVPQQLAAYESEAKEVDSIAKMSFKDLFTKSYLRTPLIIALVMHISQQWSGIIAVLNYSTSIFTNAGLSESDAQYSTIGTTGVIVVMTIISVGVMDRVGRRVLHLMGLGGCLVSLVIITVALFIQAQEGWAKYLSVASLVLFIMSFGIGPGSIPWFITAELFDQAARPYAISLAILVNWGANLTSGLLFPLMQKGMGDYCFIPFVCVLLACGLFIFFKLPETKNRSTEEIVAMFQDGRGSGRPSNRAASQPKHDRQLSIEGAE